MPSYWKFRLWRFLVGIRKKLHLQWKIRWNARPSRVYVMTSEDLDTVPSRWKPFSPAQADRSMPEDWDFHIKKSNQWLNVVGSGGALVESIAFNRRVVPSNIQVPRSSTKFGDCSFSVARPTVWNILPDYVKNAYPWRHLNLGSKPIFLNIHMIAANSLNTCTAPFPSASAKLQRFTNRLIKYYYYSD